MRGVARIATVTTLISRSNPATFHSRTIRAPARFVYTSQATTSASAPVRMS
jgi:hypothetical protein